MLVLVDSNNWLFARDTVLINPCTVIFDGPLSYKRLQKLRKKGHTGLHVQDFETSILAPTDYEVAAVYLKVTDTLNDKQRKNKYR